MDTDGQRGNLPTAPHRNRGAGLRCPEKAEPSSSGALKQQSRRRRADWAGWAGAHAGRCGGSKEGAGSLVARTRCSHPWDLGVILGQGTKIEQKK